MSGYDIRKQLRETVSNFWSESYGQIYPVLSRLTEVGLVTRTTEATAGRPERQVYQITEAGRQELRRWLEKPIEPDPPRLELLLKLFFASEGSPEAMELHVRQFRERELADLNQAGEISRWLGATFAKHPALPYWLMTLRYAVLVSEAHVAWCDETLETLTTLRPGLGEPHRSREEP